MYNIKRTIIKNTAYHKINKIIDTYHSKMYVLPYEWLHKSNLFGDYSTDTYFPESAPIVNCQLSHLILYGSCACNRNRKLNNKKNL